MTLLLSAYDRILLALAIWREARGESIRAKRLVCHTILNRRDDPKRWPNTTPGVILQKLQFSAFSVGDANAVKFPIPGTGADWIAWLECLAIADEPGESPIPGVNHYESAPDDNEPHWVGDREPALRMGKFEFYVL